MTELEATRFQEALDGLGAAFEKGRAMAKDPSASFNGDTLAIKVPRLPILDGEWQQFTAEFEDAGRRSQPLGELVRLLPPGVRGPGAFDGDDLVWQVVREE